MQPLTPAMRRCRQCVPTRVFAPRCPAAAARRPPPRLARSTAQRATRLTDAETLCAIPGWAHRCRPSQRSLHNAPIFRLLLKVAVNGTHQCDFSNFCGAYGSQLPPSSPPATKPRAQWLHRPGMHKPTSLQAAWRLPNQALRRLVFVLT